MMWLRVLAVALLLAGCSRETTTFGSGNPSGYGLGRTLVAVFFEPEEFRRVAELKLAERLADLEIPATVSLGLARSSSGPAVVAEANRLGGFDSLLVLSDYERRVTRHEVPENCTSSSPYDPPSNKQAKGADIGLGIALAVLSGFVSPHCRTTRTEKRISLEYRAALYDVSTLRPVWEGVSSRHADNGPECFAAKAADDVVNWLQREDLIQGEPRYLPVSGDVLASCLLP